MDRNTEVTFTLSIGFVGAKREQTFTLEELGYIKGEDFDTKEELEELLSAAWEDWSNDYINGGWHIED